MQAATPRPYDLFISYSRRDNAAGRVAELVQHIAAEYRRSAGEELRYFFDTQEIRGMDDWRHRILDGIRQARLLLVCLSPSYLESEYCAWEFNEYLKHEAARALIGEGIAPVYLAAVDWDQAKSEPRTAEWVAELRRRQRFDLLPWSSHGAEALKEVAVRRAMEELATQLRDRLGRLRLALDAPGNVDRHNERFVGRTSELRRLRELVGLGKVGVLTAVHGLGGIGKTALAIEYAHAFARDYGGGCWQVRCEGREDLRVVLATLASALHVEFTDTEKPDVDAAFGRILAELQARATNAMPSRCLLILDNVDQPQLLEPAQTARLPATDWLHIVATTRLGEKDLFGTQPDRAFLPVDELPEEDSLALIEGYQPGRTFRDDAERAAARQIVRLLGCFTLAVETAAVFLGAFAGEVSCAAFRDRLKREPLTGLEAAVSETNEGTRHGEMRLSATLRPTLERLSEAGQRALTFAAFLPPDHVPLPWIRELTGQDFPELWQDTEPGHPDPWQTLLRRLFSLRLLQITSEPREVRIHRLVQELLRTDAGDSGSAFGQAVIAHVEARAEFLRGGWVQPENRWELVPLTACCWLWMEDGRENGTSLTSEVAGGPLLYLSNFAEAEPLLRRALAIDEQTLRNDHPNVARDLNNLAQLLRATNRPAEAEPLLRRATRILENPDGEPLPNYASALDNLAVLLRTTNRLAEAEPLLRRALAIDEQTLGPDHPNVAIHLNHLAGLLQDTNRSAEAEPLMRRAVAISEKSLGGKHPHVAVLLSNLALLLKRTNRLPEAETLYRRALAIHEQTLGPHDPNVATDLNNLARVLQDTNRLVDAEALMRRALAIFEESLGAEHPSAGLLLNNLATLLYAANRLVDAEPLMQRALAIDEKSLGPDHPSVSRDLNNLGRLLQDTNRPAEAEPLFRRALAIDEQSFGPDHPEVAADLANLARLLKVTNRLAEAETLYRRALAIGERSLGLDHPDVAVHLHNLAALLKDTSRLAEAELLSRRSLVIFLQFTARTGHEHPDLRAAFGNYRQLLEASGIDHTEIERRLAAVRAEATSR